MFVSTNLCNICGPGSSVGIATDYGLDGPGIKSRWGRDFPPIHTSPGAHPTFCTMGIGSFPGVKCGRGVLLTTHTLLEPRSCKGRAIPLPTLSHNQSCNEISLPYVIFKILDIWLAVYHSITSLLLTNWYTNFLFIHINYIKLNSSTCFERNPLIIRRSTT